MPVQTIDTTQILGDYKNYLWPFLEKYLALIKDLPEFCQISKNYHDVLDFHFQLSSEYSQRKGKYIRPILLMLTAEALGCQREKALNTAIAMQLSEDWILNHDDIEDDSMQRRGLPALHKTYGVPLAINAGDAIHNLTWKVLNDNQTLLGPDLTKKISDEFFTMINRTLIGQTVEIKWTQDNRFDLSLDDVLFILESKTGYYTIAGPMRLGAIIAGADSEQLEKIYKFGINLGRVFQIKDDLLDLTSDFAGQKKQQGNDVYEGKRTVMLTHLAQIIEGDEKTKFFEVMKKTREQKTETEIKWVIEMMHKYGSIDYAQNLLNQYQKEVYDLFDTDLKFLSQNPSRDYIKTIVDFIATRDH
jgi:geranylgeranyl diphosphate synthase type II